MEFSVLIKHDIFDILLKLIQISSLLFIIICIITSSMHAGLVFIIDYYKINILLLDSSLNSTFFYST